MGWFIFGLILLVINLLIGIDDVRKKNAGWRPALTWLAVGIVLMDVLQQVAHAAV